MNETSIKKAISTNISKYRKKSGMNQKSFAEKLGVTPSRVSNWEQGLNCPTIDILFDVCEVLSISINDIYGVYPNSDMRLAFNEQEMVKKYRKLDSHSQEMVDLVLGKEYDRCCNISNFIYQKLASAPSMAAEEAIEYGVNVTHERTDTL
jgi:Predicted transcriptional regulators